MKPQHDLHAAPELPDLYRLYEASVQSPEYHVELYENLFRQLRGAKETPLRLREDFSGTFFLSSHWVRSHRARTALAIDLDAGALASGRDRHWAALKPSQRDRLVWKRADVRTVTRPGSDIIVVGNFSYCVFKQRKDLVAYFKAAHASLAAGRGILTLEVGGGPGFICRTREREKFKCLGKRWLYTWEQREFDPNTHFGEYAIHFKDLKTNKRYDDAFFYDWRVWTLPELRDAMLEAGFKRCEVFWETKHRGKGTGEYLPARSGENSFNWITYIVGLR